MKSLIINADDFGKFSKVNIGIIEGIQANVITSTSLLVFGKYAHEAKRLLEFENISVGLHYEKRFDNEEDMVKDFDLQLQMFIGIMGRNPDHIDFHKLHGLENYPILAKRIVEYTKDNKIPGRRMGLAKYIGDFFAMDKNDYKTIDLEKVSISSLIKVLDSNMVDGANELMCHAGRVDKEVEVGSSYWSARELELETLLSKEFKAYIEDKGIKLVSWKDYQEARKPFKKSLNLINIENAHGGSGRRQLILSNSDPISSQMEAMTKGFIPPRGAYDWHKHEDIDEFFLVTQGTGIIEFEDGTKMEYSKDDLIYIPSNIKHRIENTGDTENEFFFIRLNH